jgi:hypothetical protein
MSDPVHGDPKLDEQGETFLRDLKKFQDETTLKNFSWELLRDIACEAMILAGRAGKHAGIKLKQSIGGIISARRASEEKAAV